MTRHTFFFTLALAFALLTIHSPKAWARGLGGHVGGGFGGRLGGGGLGGGLGGRVGGGGLGGEFGGGRLSGDLAGRLGGGGFSGGELRNRLGNEGFGGLGGSGLGGDVGQRFSGLSGGASGPSMRPSRSSLSNFLGLPSDGGLHNLAGETQSRGSQIYDQLRQGDGPAHNFISGETQSPGSRLYDSIKSGNQPFQNVISGQTQSRGSQIYSNINANRQNFISGQTQSAGSRAYDYLRANHPLQPISPWRIHNNSVVIRRNFNNYNFYTGAWYRRYPRAWYPTVWAYGSPWVYVPWPTLSVWMGYPAGSPIYYDYGTNVIYQDNSVYVNGQDVGTSAQYYQQAQTLAQGGADQEPAQDAQWMPLGVFALSQAGQTSSNMVIQLAVNRQGVIRGNYTNSASGENSVVEGGVDKQSQRAAWIIGDNKDVVFDTGLYNLTKDETPVLVHFSDDRTEQWLMVRLENKGQSEDQNPESAGD